MWIRVFVITTGEITKANFDETKITESWMFDKRGKSARNDTELDDTSRDPNTISASPDLRG